MLNGTMDLNSRWEYPSHLHHWHTTRITLSFVHGGKHALCIARISPSIFQNALSLSIRAFQVTSLIRKEGELTHERCSSKVSLLETPSKRHKGLGRRSTDPWVTCTGLTLSLRPPAPCPLLLSALSTYRELQRQGERRLHLCGGIRDRVKKQEISKDLLAFPKSNTVRLNLAYYSFLEMGSRIRGCLGASRIDTERKPLKALQDML